MDVVCWDNCQISGQLENGYVVGVLGDMGTYNNRSQLTARRIKILEDDPAPYMRGPGVPVQNLHYEFKLLLNSIDNSFMKTLLERIFNEATEKMFVNAPAARKIHHHYTGGLLEHTLNVARSCKHAAESYPELNRDLLITGALLHDIGKIWEYEIKAAPQYTAAGRLMGHIVLGSELLNEKIKELRQEGMDFPDKLEWMLKHMILSHHGSLEFGSPVVPLFPEAFVLYMMDNLDAKLFVYKEKINENAGQDELFTSYDSFFGQYFFTYRLPSENNGGQDE
ncbi:3'-5' exoribonuclease YhaM family protein [Syntrophomonas palmitatica]|uniref:3'-5' exoribonuclease YhaM family protein n=1 Tax=Syntrophomonas palmitatica TaxID=402877 RepID=UPI0034E20D1B